MTRVVAFLQPGWADWEAGPVLAYLRAHAGAEVKIATPDGGPQPSIGGVVAQSDIAFGDVGPDEADIYLAIGSDAWPGYQDEAFFRLLQDAHANGNVVGAICGATVAAARAGLFEGRRHTSNDRAWLAEIASGYLGAELYQDVHHAVVDNRVVSAGGVAPNTFAIEILNLAQPGLGEKARPFLKAEWA